MDETTLRRLFTTRYGRAPEIVARAPGRVEFIGNHTDYNGGAVLGAAIDRCVWVAAAPADVPSLRFVSGEEGGVVETSLPATGGRFAGSDQWAHYPLGVWLALGELGFPRPPAFDLLVLSDLPVGAGLSSSAALELATALALIGLVPGASVDRAQLAAIGRRAENVHVGVPCGILDQGSCAFGAPGRLVHIDCRGPVFTTVPISPAARLWVFDSREKHSLVDGLYAERHRECMSAARVLGVAWLAEVAPEELPRALPLLDPPVRDRARHVIEENARVAATVTALESGDLAAAGRLLTASHRSSRRFFANSTPALDSLADRLSAHPRTFGARLTGGGFGGAVLALTGPDFSATDAAEIATGHTAAGHPQPQVLALQTAAGASVVWRRD